jgi:hypothetical protein
LIASIAREQDARVVQLSYRHRQSAFCGQRLRLLAIHQKETFDESGLDVRLTVLIEDAEGNELTTGEGTLQFRNASAARAFVEGAHAT